MKISLVITVYNEEETISFLLNSVVAQTRKPDEVIIVDAGSTDSTLTKIKNYGTKIKELRVVVKKGNRSKGRNEGIRISRGEIIALTDAGCVLDKNWVKKIAEPFRDLSVSVVAGYYKGKAKGIFQKSLIPYVLVMPDKLQEKNFFPATRSMAFRKKVWDNDKFPEEYSHNEDYVFAKKLDNRKVGIFFQKDAIVHWIPRKNLRESFIMFFRFALGDGQALILRTKVMLIFARYILILYVMFLSILYKSYFGFSVILLSAFIYIIWSIKKNYKYIGGTRAFLVLPVLQFVSDVAVLFGTSAGLFTRVKKINVLGYIKKNKFFLSVVIVYSLVILSTLNWGIPNENQPFPYHMDEWHQFQAVRATAKFGTPNILGAANGTMFHFLSSAVYLAPFTLLQYIDPVVLKIDDFVMRERIFELLRLNTLLYGTLSILLIYKISQQIKANTKISVLFFTFTPIWLILSGYFKYDIALIFWILLSLYFYFRIYKNPTHNNFLLAAIPSALAVGVKVSAVPLLLVYLFSYFWFVPSKIQKFKYLLSGVGIFVLILFLFGMPDLIFGKGNFGEYLYDNIVRGPNNVSNIITGTNSYVYLFFRQYPVSFGYGIFILLIASLLYWVKVIYKGRLGSIEKHKIIIFLLFSFGSFLLSILPLQLSAIGNRSLVILPFTALIIGFTFKSVMQKSKIKPIIIAFVLLMFGVQIYQSFSFMYIKWTKSNQETSSKWMKENISSNQSIGIENIPIYQYLPSIVEKEFYFGQYGVDQEANYRYEVISSESEKLPQVIILTNAEIESKVLKVSPKKKLLNRVESEGYKKIASFSPNLLYFKIFASSRDYYLSGLVTSPENISIFRK